MPTGYTASVQEGTTTELKDYILACARNFGALIHMRDEDTGAQIRFREVSSHHKDRLDSAKKEYEKFCSLSDEEIQRSIDESYERSLIERKEQLNRFEEGKKRYEDMLAKVKEWEPPTEHHANLKNFAISQLELSIDNDYSDSMKRYYTDTPEKMTVEEYKDYRIKDYSNSKAYHSKAYEEEVASVQSINSWITSLIDSFKEE